MKPVLMAASLSPRGVAVLRRAGALARAADAPLELLHAVSPFAPRKAERSAMARLHLAAASLREQFGLTVSSTLVRGRVAPCLVARAHELAPRLVVLGFGLAGRVQRRIATPVLAVSSQEVRQAEQRIVFATDLSPEDGAAIAALRRDHPQAALHVLYISPWYAVRPLRLALAREEPSWRYRHQALAEAARELRRFADRHGLDGVSLEARLGHVPAALRRRAQQLDACLLVLSPERSWLKAALGASVTRAVLAAPPCDVLLRPRPDAGPRERAACRSPAW